MSGLTTLTNLSVQSTLSSAYIFSPNAVITTLSLTSLSVSSSFVAPGIASSNSVTTISYANVQNTLSTGYLFSSNAAITTLSATTLNVSGLTTLTNLSVQSTLSSAYIFSPNAVITTLSTTALNVSGSLTVNGTTVFPNLSGLETLDGIPVLFNPTLPFICIGINTSVSGSDVITLGISAGLKNSGTHVYAIGCNAVTTNSGDHVYAIGYQTGSSNTGANVVAIGSNTAWSNSGNTVIAIGDGACTTNSGALVIAIGSNAGRVNGGGNTIAIGTNAGYNNNASLGIFIGSNAGSSNGYSNVIAIGNNPSGLYTISSHNTFVIYSTVCTAPFIQGDLSGLRFGIGKAPTTTLDVSGSALISGTLNVSGKTTISAAQILNAVSVSGLATLSAATILTNLNVSGVATLGAVVVQGTLSSTNIYVSGTTNGLQLATNVPFTMNAPLSNTGSSFLNGVNLASINAINWPSSNIIPSAGSILTISTDGANAFWEPPGASLTLSGWWNIAPTTNLNMNGYGLTNLSSINGIGIAFNSTYSMMGIGTGALVGAVAAGGSNIIAIGPSAGIGSSGSNLIYLGSNPGGTQTYNNRFIVYSTTSGLPFLQGDVSGMMLGIGKSPQVGLDVSGSGAFTNNLNVSGTATLPYANLTTVSASNVYTSNVLTVSGLATLSAAQIQNNLSVSGTATLPYANLTTVSASNVYISNVLTVNGLATLSATQIQNNLSVSGTATLPYANLTTVSASNVYISNTLTVSGLSTLSGVVISKTLNVSGLTSLSNLQAATISGSLLFSSGALNISGQTTLSGTTIQTTLSVAGITTLSGTQINGTFTACGQTLFNNLCFASINGLTWPSPAATTGSTVLSVDSTGKTLTWASLTTIGVQNWAQSKANSTVSLEGYGLAGITTFNNISAVFISASAQVGLGLGVLANNPASNVLAFGTNAGSVTGNPATYGVYSNNMFLGSNPGGSCNVSNSLVVYSQTAGSPLIYGDLSKNQVTIAGQANTGGYTLNVNGSAQASMFASPAASSNSIGGVTMSNSILTVGTVCNVTNLNGLTTKFDSAAQVIFIGSPFGVTPLPAGTVNVFLGQFAGANYGGVGTVGIGDGAGAFLTGSGNICIGGSAGNSSTGSCNNFIGSAAGKVSSGSYVNAIGASAAYGNLGSYVDTMGYQAGWQNVATGSNLIAIGSNAGFSNWGASNIYIGAGAGNGGGPQYNSNSCNAIVIGSLAGVSTNGNANIGNRSINIGKGSSTSQGAGDQIAIGTGAQGGYTGSIAIGAGAIAGGGLRMLVIGSNVSGGTGAADVIAIGTNAGSNLPNLSNNIYIGSNAGYNPTTANTLVVQSLASTAPTLQADLANRRLGVGCAPTYSIDVQVTSAGSNGMRIAQNNTSNVTAGLYLEAGLGGGSSLTNYAVVSFGTRTGGQVDIAQSIFSLYEGLNYGLSIKGGNTAASTTIVRVDATNNRVGIGTVSPTTTLDVSGTLNVKGATTLSAVSLTSINGVAWPTATTAPAYPYLMALQASGSAAWIAIGAAESTGWAYNPALQAVNMAGFGLTSLTSINGLKTAIDSTNNQIGIGANVLALNTGTGSIAFGCNAGSNSTATAYANCIYLGSNSGTSATAANTFLVYSTNATIPFLQGDMANIYLGIGVAPAYTLDVKGTAHVSTNLLLNGNMAIGTNLPAATSYPINIKGTGTTTGTIAFYNSVVTTTVPYVGVGYDETNDGFAIRTNFGANDLNTTALFIKRSTAIPYVGVQTTTPLFPLDVSGQINTNASFSSPTTSSNSIGGITLSGGNIITTGTARLGNTVAGTISGTNLTATGSLTVSGLTTLSAAVVQYALNVSGLTSLSNLQAATISGYSLYSFGSITAALTVAATTVSGSTVNAGTITSTGNTTVLGTLSAATTYVTGTTTLMGYVGIGGAFNTSYPLTVSGTINCTSNIISTLNVAGIPSGSALTLLATNATTYYSLTTQAQTINITFPTTTPTQGTYWVVKNNSTVNYTLTATNGVFNGGNTTSYYLQSGIGITLAYSGTQGTNGSNAYYTF